MAGQQWVRLNLASSIFPFMTEFDGRSVIQAGLDQNYNYLDQVGEPVKDRGIPQSIYMHNVMPTSQGYQSVGYDLVSNSNLTTDGPVTTFDTCFELTTIDPALGNKFSAMYSPNNFNSAHNDFLFYLGSFPVAWSAFNNPRTSHGTDDLVTTAFVGGVTYICKASDAYSINPSLLYKYVSVTALAPVTLLGLTVANIRGICASNGYMITWDNNNNVAWSNQTNALDFVPSIATGAGGGSVSQVRGQILYCLPISGGFILYCSENMVGATYTGNSQFPFAFQEIIGSSGIGITTGSVVTFQGKVAHNLNKVAYQNNLPFHYAYTSSGIQQVNLRTATGLFPEVTDFLAKLVFEDFDEVNNVLVQTQLTSPIPVKLTSVASRFLVISYAAVDTVKQSPPVTQVYTHALVFDSVLNRWGKLKIPHASVVEFNSAVSVGGTWETVDNPFSNMGFMQNSGAIYTINMALNSPTCTIPVDGVLLFGKVQSSRNKFISHQRTDLENITAGDNFSAYIIPTFDGKTLQPAQIMSNSPNLIIDAAEMKRMAMKVTCQNFLYLFKGAFNLVSLLLDYTQEGHR